MSQCTRSFLFLLLVFCMIVAAGCLTSSPGNLSQPGWITPEVTGTADNIPRSSGDLMGNEPDMQVLISRITNELNQSLPNISNPEVRPVQDNLSAMVLSGAINPVVNGT